MMTFQQQRVNVIFQCQQFKVKFYDLREASVWNSSPENEYEQFCVVAFVSRPAARGTGMQIARAPARSLAGQPHSHTRSESGHYG